MSGAAAEDVLKRYVPWHLRDDKTLLLCDGELMPLCNILRKMSAENGLVDVQLLEHSLTPKLRPATWHENQTQPHVPQGSPATEAVDGEDPVPAPFRYAVGLNHGDKTPSFKPNNLDAADPMNIKHQYLGQIFKNNYNRISSNDISGLVWEVSCLHFSCDFLGAC